MGYDSRPTIIVYDFDSNAIDKLRGVVERHVETGTVSSSGTETTGTYTGYFYIEDDTKNWSSDIWKDCVVEIVDGTGKGTVAKIIGNSTNRLYLDRTITVDTTSKYAISIEIARENTLEKFRKESLQRVFQAPLVIDFSKDWHKEVVNYEELGAEVVDLESEGITPSSPIYKYAIKVPIAAGETKYLKLYVGGYKDVQPVYYLIYIDTDGIKVTCIGGWTGTQPTFNVSNEWGWIVSRLDEWNLPSLQITNNGTTNGNVYISFIALPRFVNQLNIQSFPNQTLDGTTTYTYSFSLPIRNHNQGVARIFWKAAGDGTNAINVDVYIRTIDGDKLIASWSRTLNTLGWGNIKIPYKMWSEPNNDIQFLYGYIKVSGYGTFYQYNFSVWTYDSLWLNINGLKTASASNTSTTVTTYTLVDNNGRANRYKQATVELDGTYGTAKLYINGQLVCDASGTTYTFDIPEDLEIYKITVDLVGNGTNPATAEFKGIELRGAYICRR